MEAAALAVIFSVAGPLDCGSAPSADGANNEIRTAVAIGREHIPVTTRFKI
jgi:hypothetical protein